MDIAKIKIYSKNSTPTKLRIEYSDGKSDIVNIPYKENVNDAFYTLDITVPRLTSFARFTILDVHEGSKYDDTCITEISVIPSFTQRMFF